MQAAGLVNDHLVSCPRYEVVAAGAAASQRSRSSRKRASSR
jgi:hypothetical protein